MRAVVIEKFGGIEEVKVVETPKPTPARGEILMRIHYAGVNPVDWKIGEGVFKERMPHEFPIILGWDASGTVEQVGEGVKNFKKGDEIFAYCRKPVIRSGTFAEYVTLEEKFIALKPKNISFAEAAAIPLAALTAWQSLFGFTQLKEGNTILIHGGAGGVGSFAIEFAKWKKAKIYTTASSQNHSYVKSLGADVQIDYNKENFAEIIHKKEPNGLDIVLDCVGGNTLRESLPLVKKGGCLISIVNFNVEALAKPFNIRAGFVFVAPSGNQLSEIADLMEKNIVKPVHIEEFRMDEAKRALQKNKEGHTQGKLVLRIL